MRRPVPFLWLGLWLGLWCGARVWRAPYRPRPVDQACNVRPAWWCAAALLLALARPCLVAADAVAITGLAPGQGGPAGAATLPAASPAAARIQAEEQARARSAASVLEQDVPIGGYRFAIGHPLIYAYDMLMTVQQATAGDQVQEQASLLWKFALLPERVAPDSVQVMLTILRVEASSTSPTSSHAIDSGQRGEDAGGADPLLGPLLDLDGAILHLTLDPRTGRVSSVTGGEAIVNRIDARFPAPFPGDPPPMHAQAERAYSSEALSRLWSDILLLPPATGTVQAVSTGPPLDQAIERIWTGRGYQLALAGPGLPPGGPAPATTTTATASTADAARMGAPEVVLHADPVPVRARLVAFSGQGSIALRDGVPEHYRGDMTFDLLFTAQTQDVVQHHHVAWQLTCLHPTPIGPAGPAAPVRAAP
jgi:hypothetical protein